MSLFSKICEKISETVRDNFSQSLVNSHQQWLINESIFFKKIPFIFLMSVWYNRYISLSRVFDSGEFLFFRPNFLIKFNVFSYMVYRCTWIFDHGIICVVTLLERISSLCVQMGRKIIPGSFNWLWYIIFDPLAISCRRNPWLHNKRIQLVPS